MPVSVCTPFRIPSARAGTSRIRWEGGRAVVLPTRPARVLTTFERADVLDGKHREDGVIRKEEGIK